MIIAVNNGHTNEKKLFKRRSMENKKEKLLNGKKGSNGPKNVERKMRKERDNKNNVKNIF